MSSTATPEAEKRPAGGKRLSREARRAQIIAVASDLISRSGFNAVSIADVARACGITKSLVLYYFPSINHLLTAVLLQRDGDAFVAVLDAAAPRAEPEAARAFAMRIVEHNLTRRELVRLFHMLDAEALSPDHPAHEYFRTRSAQIRTFMERVLCWKPDPARAAIQLIAFLEGLERAWLRDAEIDMVGIFGEFCDAFFASPPSDA